MNAAGHFSGQLVECNCEQLHDLHHLGLRLIDDDGGSHQVFISYGRGAQAEQQCRQMFTSLTIGSRYHGAASMKQQGDLHTYWLGRVLIALDQRRPRFAAPTGQPAAATQGASA
jgi:hypothetical protein